MIGFVYHFDDLTSAALAGVWWPDEGQFSPLVTQTDPLPLVRAVYGAPDAETGDAPLVSAAQMSKPIVIVSPVEIPELTHARIDPAEGFGGLV